jgi:hypothetical protein
MEVARTFLKSRGEAGFSCSLEQAPNDLINGDFVLGEYHYSIAVLGDGQVVRGMGKNRLDQATGRSIREIGRITGKRAVAEFVETEQIELMLRYVGVDCIQGYCRHKSVPSADMLALRNGPLPDGDTRRPTSLS